MIAYILGPFHTLDKEYPLYEALIANLHRNGHSLACNWLEPAVLRPDKMAVPDQPEKTLREIFAAIDRSDVLIANVSDRGTFGIGYLVAYAQKEDKPILALHRRGSAKGLLPETRDLPGIVFVEFDRIDEVLSSLDSFLKDVNMASEAINSESV